LKANLNNLLEQTSEDVGSVAMIQPPSGSQIYLAAGLTDMRKGMPGLSALVKAT